jgi:hypothetical protein
MSQWALPGIAVMLIAYGAVSGRLRSTPVSQAMVFVALGLLVGGRVLDLVEADTANQFVRHPAEAGSYGHRGLRSSGAKRGSDQGKVRCGSESTPASTPTTPRRWPPTGSWCGRGGWPTTKRPSPS